MKKTITIFGSTGSIGKSTINIIQNSPEKYDVLGLTARHNYKLLAEQAISLNAKYVCIAEEKYLGDLKNLLSGEKIKVLAGVSGLCEIADLGSKLVVAAIVGSAGLLATFKSIQAGSDIALANKESLVCAGKLFINEAKKHRVKLLPTDSEHNAIFQVFEESNRDQIEKITLTASGGPFLNMPIEQLKTVTPEQATKHPNWNMGKKITVDCSNMVNKGLEIIEAHYLFNMPAEQIEVLIHPQSIIHSMVTYKDGSTLAQLGPPDMRTPISYTMDWPKRPEKSLVAKLDLAKIGHLTFQECDIKRFPAVKICKDSLALADDAKIILNAANEIAVENFLENKINYTSITKIIEKMMSSQKISSSNSIEEIIKKDSEYRTKTQEYIDGNNL